MEESAANLFRRRRPSLLAKRYNLSPPPHNSGPHRSAHLNHSSASMPGRRQQDAEDDEFDSLFVRQDDEHYDNEHVSQRRRLALPPLHSTRTARFAGDGLDMRTPAVVGNGAGAERAPARAMPQSGANVIDLTEDNNDDDDFPTLYERTTGWATLVTTRTQGLPRHSRDIMNADGAGSEGGAVSGDARTREPRYQPRSQFAGLRRPVRVATPAEDMDDFEIVGERALSVEAPVNRHAVPVALRAPRSYTPRPDDLFGANDPIDLTADDDVVFMDTRPREDVVNAPAPTIRPGMTVRDLMDQDYDRVHTMGHIAGMIRAQGGENGRLMQRFGLHDRPLLDRPRSARDRARDRAYRTPPLPAMPGAWRLQGDGRLPHIPGLPALPGIMNYDTVGFEVMPGNNRPPTPPYTPPAEAEEGFTRNPGEAEVVVCPNCGDELAVGDDERKQQVWVVKTCGHVSSHCAQTVRLYTDVSHLGLLWRLLTPSYENDTEERQRPGDRCGGSACTLQEVRGRGLW